MTSPTAYNAAQAGRLWRFEDLPAELRLAGPVGGEPFARMVLAWQRWLNPMTPGGLAPDGKLGPATLAAIRAADVVLGVDVSAHQPKMLPWVRWHKAGVRFTWIKATQDETYTSGAYREQLRGATEAEILAGMYHFAVPERGDSPEVEADRLADAHERLRPPLLPALDYEEARQGKPKPAPRLSPTELVLWAERCVAQLHRRLGRWPVLYSYQGFIRYMRPAIDPDSCLLQCPLWAAKDGPTPPDVRPWPAWRVWQYTSDPVLPGSPGRLDGNRLLGGQVALNALRAGGA